MADFDMKELMGNYIEEMHDLLEKFDITIMKLDKDKSDKPMINELFRIVHSMKGMNATMGFEHTAALIHAMEDLLYDVRDEKISLDTKAIELFFVCRDHIETVVLDIVATGEEKEDSNFKTMVDKIHSIIKEKNIIKIDVLEDIELECDVAEKMKKNLKTGEKLYKIKIFYEKTCMMKCVRGFMVFEVLKKEGEIISSFPLLEYFREGNKYDEDYFVVIIKTKKSEEEITKKIKNVTEIENVEISDKVEKSSCVIEKTKQITEHLSNVAILVEAEIAEEIKNICTEIDDKLVEMTADKKDNKLLNYFFRKFHTISGLSGMCEFEWIKEISKETEKYIDMTIKEKIKYSEEVKELILNSCEFVDLIIKEEIKHDNVELKSILKNHVNNLRKGKIGFNDDGDEKEIPKDKNENKIGKILLESGRLTEDDVIDIIVKQKENTNMKFGEIAVKEKKIAPNELSDALDIQKTKAHAIASNFIKVNTEKVDGLVDAMGELMIIQAQLEQEAASLFMSNHPFFNNIVRMSRIIKDLHQTSMSMRMVSINPIFHKLNRIAYDTINAMNKKVSVEFLGGETEVDRSVADKLSDPLMHMVRNSISHGIEEEEVRISRGKAPEGIVVISAYSKKGDVYIEVEDDGNGINMKRVYEKAIEKGVAVPSKKYTDDEILAFIFAPGFSTAAVVNSISGRGVGMDVVKTEITNIGGKIEIKNREGYGCKFILKIPINMASMNGTIVEFSGGKYIIPTMYIKEIVKIEPDKWITVKGKKSMIRVRDSIIPVLSVEEIFGESENDEKIIIILESENRFAALPVNSVSGRSEIVVKSIGEEFKNLNYTSGVSILGDGKVSLILDIENIFKTIKF